MKVTDMNKSLKAQDKKYLTWLRTQPSCLSRMVPCVSAHVRRARHSGTGYKPLFSAVPLTDEEHRWQSNHGELACFLRFYRGHLIGTIIDVQAAKNFFDMEAKQHLQRWRASCQN